MTNREFYTNIINGVIGENEIAFATAEIGKLDARNDKRRNTLTKEQIANEGIKAKILEFIGDSTKIASEIAKGIGESTNKVSALAMQLVASDKLIKTEVAIKGKGKVNGYKVKGE